MKPEYNSALEMLVKIEELEKQLKQLKETVSDQSETINIERIINNELREALESVANDFSVGLTIKSIIAKYKGKV